MYTWSLNDCNKINRYLIFIIKVIIRLITDSVKIMSKGKIFSVVFPFMSLYNSGENVNSSKLKLTRCL